jgi:hypothetical protein
MNIEGLKLQFSGREIRDMFLARAAEHEAMGKKERADLKARIEKYPSPYPHNQDLVETHLAILDNQEKVMVAELRLYAEHVVVDATYTVTSADLVTHGLLPRCPRILQPPSAAWGAYGGEMPFGRRPVYGSGDVYPGQSF